MPELPEVETVKQVIEPQIQGLTVTNVVVRRPEVIAHPAADEFCRRLVGQTFSGMRRRGKFLQIMLESKDHIVLHLRMTGCLLAAPAEAPEEKYTHLVFELSNQTKLRFSDMRRFGRFWLLQSGETDIYSGVERLGLEPFAPELTAEYLRLHWGKRRKTIKECLLEQTIVAGIGNIYSDEILFAAGLYPAQSASALQDQDWERLADLIPRHLSFFVDKNKITPEEYWRTKGREYRNTPFLQAYGHKGTPCPVCGNSFCRMVIGGRSSTYCPSCQR